MIKPASLSGVSKHENTKIRVLSGTANANIDFNDLCTLLEKLGFQRRTKGSHHIFSKQGIPEIINLQSKDGKAKPYQVRQVRALMLMHKLGL